MNTQDWIPALSTTGAFAAALWLLRALIMARLKASVEHEFNQKLEALRTTLKNSEESFKAELRKKEMDISTLRSGALSALASRQVALDKRRIEAVDQLWSAVTALAPAKYVSANMAVLKYEVALKYAENNAELRAVFATMGGNFDTNSISSHDSEKARPFVSPLIWAYFSAYHSIISAALLRAKLLASGVNIPGILDTDKLNSLVAAALPHRIDHAKKHGIGAYHYLLDELEICLLEEMRKMLQGAEGDKASVEQAAAIMKASEAIIAAAEVQEQ